MNKKVFLLILITALKTGELIADKNFFTSLPGTKPYWQTRDGFIKTPNHCNIMFEPGHPEAFEPNKTFLTFYGDSLGDLVNEQYYGYFGWDQYLTLMYPAVEWNVQNLAHSGDTNEGIPIPFLVMAREKAVAIRQKVNEELILRGVNHL